jgi:hypothetical protein
VTDFLASPFPGGGDAKASLERTRAVLVRAIQR